MTTTEVNLIFHSTKIRLVNASRNLATRNPSSFLGKVHDKFGTTFIGDWTGYVMVF